MIVECSNCQTRFQLDESRVPLRGIRVRCSHCKQAFFLQHPSASEAGAIDDVAANAAAESTQDGSPEFTQDLPPESSVESSPEPGELEEEEDWEFNEDPPDEDPNESSANDFMDPESDPFGPAPGAAEEAGADARADIGFDGDDDASDFGEAGDFSTLADEVAEEQEQPEAAAASPAPPVQQAPTRVSVEDVGEPEDWDFFSDESLEPPSSMEPIDDAMGPAMEAIEADAVPQATEPGPELAAIYSDSRSRLGGLPNAGRMVGWLVTVALCGLGIARGVFHVAPSGSHETRVVDFGDIQAEEIRATWLDTSRYTQLYAVRGRLVNDGVRAVLAGGGTQVALLSTQGERLEIPASRAGLPLAEQQLRELSQDALAEAATVSAAQLARTRLEPGQAVDFQAFFDHVPDEAASFLVEMTEPAPAAPAPVPEPVPEDARTTPSFVAVPKAPAATPGQPDPTNLP